MSPKTHCRLSVIQTVTMAAAIVAVLLDFGGSVARSQTSQPSIKTPRTAGEKGSPPSTSELLQNCISTLATTASRVEAIGRRFRAKTKGPLCADKQELDDIKRSLAKWKRTVTRAIEGKIKRGLAGCRVKLGMSGCQALEYKLTEDKLSVHGKLLKVRCTRKVFADALKEFSTLELDLSRLENLVGCYLAEDKAVPYQIALSRQTQRPQCVDRNSADRHYRKLPKEKECERLGQTISRWKSFSGLQNKSFWILGEDGETLYLCRKTTSSWKPLYSNLGAKCGSLLIRK